MLPLQKIHLNQSQKEILWDFYSNDSKHSFRQRAHAVILSDKGFSKAYISEALELEENLILKLLKIWVHFEMEGIFSNNLNFYFRKVIEIEKPKPIKPLFDWQIFRKKLIKSIENFIKNSLGFLATIFALLTGFIFLFFKKNENISNTNEVNIENGNDNKILNININFLKGNFSEKFDSRNFGGFKTLFDELFLGKQSYSSNDKFINHILRLEQKVRKLKNQKLRNFITGFLSATIAFYIIWAYNSSLLGKIFYALFLILIAFATSVSTCSQKFSSTVSTPEATENIIDNESNPLTVISSDTINNNREEVLNDTLTPKGLPEQEFEEELNIFDFFSPSQDCPNLSNLNYTYIDQDTKAHEYEEYFINFPDNTIYIHVAAYDKISEAAFQREYLLQSGYDKSKIVESEKDGEIIFLVTIDEFNQYESGDDYCLEIFDWNSTCEPQNSQAALFYNN